MSRGRENLWNGVKNLKVLEVIYRKIICIAINYGKKNVQKNMFKGVLPAINAGKNFCKHVSCGADHRPSYTSVVRIT